MRQVDCPARIDGRDRGIHAIAQRRTSLVVEAVPHLVSLGDRAAHHLVCGKPRSTFEVAGSGQRAVTTLARV